MNTQSLVKNMMQEIQHNIKVSVRAENIADQMVRPSLSTNITFAEWAPYWLFVYKQGVVKDNTYNSTYREPVELHLIPYFGLAKAKTNEAVLAVAAHNVSEMYGGVRESAGTARRYRSGMWNSTVSTADVLQALIVSLDAVPHGMGLLVPDSFQLNRLDTRFINQEGTNLNFITTMEVEIPLSVGGGLLPPVRKTLEVRTTYEPKF